MRQPLALYRAPRVNPTSSARESREVPPVSEPPTPVRPEPLRVVVREDPAPGHAPQLPESRFDDAKAVAAARKSRVGGYLKLPLLAAKALGKKVILLDRTEQGEDLVLRVRLFPIPQLG